MTLPSNKTYNDILDSHYETFGYDVSAFLAAGIKGLDEWLNYRVAWEDVVKKLLPDKNEWEKMIPKLTGPNKHGQRAWKVQHVYQHVDVWRWYVETGQKFFPLVAKLARVWFGRSISTAFQEKVLSAGSFVKSRQRTRTDNERANDS
ncbi:hypothetical protein GN958_ATG02928 [Phytophthora infestans]|uniref:Uncharacterized protein n=1 Tax=Phytophthora infestans TaxID=4787 RepID=A0A8S9V8Z5_PHYIN|nr:hypothetical protein GN958_ATG02928 [Phytophthora infestans]